MAREKRKRVVITGIGVISPNAIGAENFGEACLAGKSGLTRIEGIDTSPLRSTIAAQVHEFNPLSVLDSVDARRVPRVVPLALAASKEALESAQVRIDPQNIDQQREIGVAFGTGGGGLAFVEDQYRAWFTEGKGSLFSITAGTHGNLSSELSIQLHLRGPSHVLSTGCTSSTDAIAYAAMLIRDGVIPMMLAGGADAPVNTGILLAFERMRVVTTRQWDDPTKASRPFSLDRDGFVLGEGAWMFILEEREHALHRGAPILAEFAGYGSTCDAYHRVRIAPEILEPVRAIEMSLQEAGLPKDDVDYINLHGTSTELNDKMETLALKKCFGDRAYRIPMSSTKSMIGHPQGACGAAGLAATIICMRRGAVHPTINLDKPDPECDLDYVPNVARTAQVNVALCNCIAFGSKNSAMVITSA